MLAIRINVLGAYHIMYYPTQINFLLYLLHNLIGWVDHLHFTNEETEARRNE